MRFKLLILSLLCGFVWHLNAQTDDVAQDTTASQAAQAAQESLEIFTRNEINFTID